MKYNFFLPLISLIMFQCDGQKNEKIIQIKNFEDEDVSVNKLFVINQANILIGVNKINYDTLSSSAAMIINTNDSAVTWQTKRLGIGIVQDITGIDGKTFLITNISSKEAYALIDSSVLYLSTNKGVEWEKLYTFPFFVNKIFFTDEKHGYAVCSNQRGTNNWMIMYTENGGYDWNKIYEKIDSAYSKFEMSFADDNNLYFLTVEKSGTCRLLKFKDQDIDTLSFDLPDSFTVCSITRAMNSDEFFIIGTQNRKIVLYKYDSKEIRLISQINTEYSPDFAGTMNVNNVTINIVVRKISGLGTKTKIFRSTDNGLSWQEIELVDEIYFTPYTFFKGKVYGYSGVARIQVVE